MKHTTLYIAALIITATVIMNVSTVFAQEWRVLLGQGVFQTDQLSKLMEKKTVEPKDWLTTQTPLLKNTPITSVDQNQRPAGEINFDSEYSQVGSWAPLQTNKGNESFTLFTF